MKCCGLCGCLIAYCLCECAHLHEKQPPPKMAKPDDVHQETAPGDRVNYFTGTDVSTTTTPPPGGW